MAACAAALALIGCSSSGGMSEPGSGGTSGGAGGGSPAGSGGAPDAAADVASAGSGGASGESIVDGLLALTRTCKTPVSHAYAFDSDPSDPDAGKTTTICELEGAVFWVADMDIDCDGNATPGKCDANSDLSYFADTAVHGNNGPLTAAITPYVVIPTDFTHTGLSEGTVAAVIYRGRLTYAVFGDTGPTDIIGEASYACAERLGINPNAKIGGVQGATVTYVVFTKSNDSVPQNVEDQAETKTLGESLAKELLDKNKP
jgi:Fungal chitosanase of glycosyl hydrolase group 75